MARSRLPADMDWPKLLGGLAVLVVVALVLGGLVGLRNVLEDAGAISGLAVALAVVATLTVGGVLFRRNASNPYW